LKIEDDALVIIIRVPETIRFIISVCMSDPVHVANDQDSSARGAA